MDVPVDPPASEAPAPTDARPSADLQWGRYQGLMAGITLAHGVQPLAAGFGDIPWTNKYYVSLVGTALYGTATALALYEKPAALWIGIVGPLVGLTSVTTLFVLDRAGVETDVRPDAFQIGTGVTLQLPAGLIAWRLLKRRGEW